MTASGTDLDLYTVLGVNPSATKDEIKERYQQLVLRLHPDKGGEHPVEHLPADARVTFDQVVKAWKVLGDDEERRRYDALLRVAAVDEEDRSNVYKTVDWAEMEVDNEFRCYPCRCGQDFQLCDEDLEDIGDDPSILLYCEVCPLMLEVILPRRPDGSLNV